MSKRRDEMMMRLGKLGFDTSEARTLLRISATLHTWAEHECNGAIQRDGETNVPYWYNTMTGKQMGRTSDREAGALKRAQAIAAERGFKVYHQGDPRGCALYLYRQCDLEAFGKRMRRDCDGVQDSSDVAIDSCYSSVGTAVCSD